MHGEEFTPFSINTGLIFWTLVVFGILLALLWKLGWPALLKAVEERERRIQQQLEEAERARAEAARLLEEHKRLVAAARAEAQELIAQQYQALVDVKRNRVHAGVTLLEEPDARLEKEVIERLSQAIGKEVRAHFRADRGILGGVVVRVGDRIYDGSVRRKLATLRRKLIVGE